MRIQAAVTRAKDAPFTIEPMDLAAIRPSEVLVRLVGSGICHTDLAIVHQHFPVPLPLVLGHEGAGIVAEVGAEVRSLAAGDRVVLTFESCGRCSSCESSHPAYCDHFAALNYGRTRPDGTPYFTDAHGTAIAGRCLGQSSFATYVIATPRNAVKVPADIPLEMVCGLGCGFMTGASAVMGLERLRADSTFAVLGAGALGFAAMFAARARGCKRIVMVDRHQTRLALARKLGSSEVIDTTHEDLETRLSELGGIDFCIDTTGFAPVVETAVKALKRLGTLVLLGGSPQRVAAIDIVALLQGKTLRGEIFGDADPHRVLAELFDWYRSGRFPVDRLIRTYAFDQINVAAADAASGATIKPVLLF
jgi:aryl-alcohol dehydrogenase